MLGCKNIPLVRSIFGLDERSSYMRAPVYFCLNLLAAFTQPGASTLADLCTSAAVHVDSVSCVACKVALYFRRAEGKACGAPKALPMY